METGEAHPDFFSQAPLPSPSDTPWPMVVWLRGDEAYCGDFSLDAEAVMAKLGIRRTRLTQISGRELRVGRIRKGRYIVPVYRPIDVMEYQQWTRASVAHVKSSTVGHEAADNLRQTIDQLTGEVSQIAAQLNSSLADTVRKGAMSTAALTLPRLDALDQRLDAIEAQVRHHQSTEARLLADLSHKVSDLGAEVDLVKGLLQMAQRDLLEVTGLARLLIEERRHHELTLAASLQAIESKLRDDKTPPPPRHAVSRSHSRRLHARPNSMQEPLPRPIRRNRAQPV